MKTIRRFVPASDLALVDVADAAPLWRGHAVVWYNPADPGTEYNIGGWRERISNNAFGDLTCVDVMATFNHDFSKPLARTKAGTLRLANDERGLVVEIEPADTSYARDLRALLARGDVTGMSFIALVDDEIVDSKQQIATINRMQLKEVSIVTRPAYTSTDIEVLRSRMPDDDDVDEDIGQDDDATKEPPASVRANEHDVRAIITLSRLGMLTEQTVRAALESAANPQQEKSK